MPRYSNVWRPLDQNQRRAAAGRYTKVATDFDEFKGLSENVQGSLYLLIAEAFCRGCEFEFQGCIRKRADLVANKKRAKNAKKKARRLRQLERGDPLRYRLPLTGEVVKYPTKQHVPDAAYLRSMKEAEKKLNDDDCAGPVAVPG